MSLSPGQRIDLKKRLIDAMYAQTWPDARLIFTEFGFSTFDDAGNQNTYVRETISPASDETLLELDRYLHPPAPPMAELLEDESNTTFEPDDLDRVTAVLTEIKRRAADLPDEERVRLEAKLDYLIEAARHSRRKEWLIVAVTVISQPFVDGILTPGTVDTVLKAMETGLGALFGHPTLQLGP